MEEHKMNDLVAINKLIESMTLLLKGKYSDEIVIEGCSEELYALIYMTNKAIEQIKALNDYVIPIAAGNLDVERPAKTNFLTAGMKALHSRLVHLTWQAQQVAKGDYKQRIDFMGGFSEAFNTMIKMLEERENLLKVEIEERTKAEEEVRNKNELIMESIEYASILQHSLLTDIGIIQAHVEDVFLIWKPRDLVGGDFYMMIPTRTGFYMAVVDCTGHGVPGAFMTIAAMEMLKSVFNDEFLMKPHEILNQLDEMFKSTFSRFESNKHFHAGLDIGLCQVDKNAGKLFYSGARMPLFYLSEGVLTEIGYARRSIGYHNSIRKRAGKVENFTSAEIDYKAGDGFYFTTDGLTDQRGSEGDIFGFDLFEEILVRNASLPFEKQKQLLLLKFTDFIGDEDQRDDVTVVGFSLK